MTSNRTKKTVGLTPVGKKGEVLLNFQRGKLPHGRFCDKVDEGVADEMIDWEEGDL
jgi:hypothetical protein